MSDDAMRELYQETILAHNKSPRNFRTLPGATRKQEGFNPLCGDRVTVFVRLDGDRLADVAFQGSGCAISTASASLMTEAVKGRSAAEVEGIASEFQHLILRDCPADAKVLGKLRVFAGVGEYPARVKCATLSWHALLSALRGEKKPVSTE
ncbi:MAG TPA: SUF system NifU family Fe-S cluster assembly protein [Candidatus Thermoplasmatota archaeon]|nr:SUF system NifU family Fe-S cluster assembly protein [Candidatus Thermoplasmatota archaeon]